jgi:branched-chain amino acid transport system substrate-binding protein
MSMKKTLGLALIVGLLAVSVPGRAAEPFEINVIASMTGAGGFLGRQESTALGILETTINNAGGLDGRPVKFAIQDDQSNPQVAVQLANTLLAKGVPVIIGPSLVASCQALAPIIKGKAVIFCISSGFHPEPNSYGFFAGISTLDQLVIAVRYLRLRGLTKIAAITSSDANGQDADHGIALALARPENKGMSLVADEHFGLSDLTVDAQMARIKASGAQVIINYNTGTPFGTVLHGYTDLGLTIPLMTQPAALNALLVSQYAAYLPKEFLVTGLIADAPSVISGGPVRAALDTYFNAFKAAGVQPDHSTALAWDPALIIVAAYKKFGLGASAAQINGFIQSLHGWAGINGEYDFRTGQGGLTSRSQVIVRWSPESKSWVAATKPGGTL